MIRDTSDNSARLIDGVLQPNKIKDVGESSEDPPECIDSEGDSKITMLYVGRFEEVKNPIDAIELIATLPTEYRLLMIGDGPLKQKVRSTINDLGVASQVTLLGSQQHKTTLYYIKQADVLLLTSKIEAYPTVVFEALALETPVLATPVGILPEVSQSRLLLSSIEEMPAMIKNCDFKSGQGLDSEVLMNYSIDHFVNEVDRSLSKVSRHTDTGQ
jgi:glycosyltransferase involved in cell wall biosynthesis